MAETDDFDTDDAATTDTATPTEGAGAGAGAVAARYGDELAVSHDGHAPTTPPHPPER